MWIPIYLQGRSYPIDGLPTRQELHDHVPVVRGVELVERGWVFS